MISVSACECDSRRDSSDVDKLAEPRHGLRLEHLADSTAETRFDHTETPHPLSGSWSQSESTCLKKKSGRLRRSLLSATCLGSSHHKPDV